MVIRPKLGIPQDGSPWSPTFKGWSTADATNQMENAQKTPLEISNKAFIWEFPACFRERAGKTMEKPGNMWICQCVTTEVMAMSIPKMMRNHRNWTSTPCSDKAMWSLPSRDFTWLHPIQISIADKPTKKSMYAREYWEMYEKTWAPQKHQKQKTANHLHGTLGPASTVTNSHGDGRSLRDGDRAPRVSGGTAIVAPKTGWWHSEGLLYKSQPKWCGKKSSRAVCVSKSPALDNADWRQTEVQTNVSKISMKAATHWFCANQLALQSLWRGSSAAVQQTWEKLWRHFENLWDGVKNL